MKKLGSKMVAISAGVVIVCFVLLSLITTSFGSVKVSNVYFPDQQGNMLHGVLYVPKEASIESKAPAVITAHGGNGHLTQVEDIAFEYSRRGYVVLNLDCNGSGLSDYSSPISDAAVDANGHTLTNLENDGGVGRALAYLKTFDFVDQNRIGMIGHSMGGTYCFNTAMSNPDDVNAVLVIASGGFSIRLSGIEDGTVIPFNLGYTIDKHDEYITAIMGIRDTSEMFKNEVILKNFNATDNPLIPGKQYGSFADKTGRIIYSPDCTHNGNLISAESIADDMEFMDLSIGQTRAIDYTNLTYGWKEFIGMVGIVGLGLFLIGLTLILAQSKFFAEVTNEQGVAPVKISALHRIIAIVVCALVPIIFFYKIGLWLPTTTNGGVSKAYPMIWSNIPALWAFVSSIVLCLVFVCWHFIYGKKHGGNMIAYGYSTSNSSKEISARKLIKSFVIAAIVFVSYLALLTLLYTLCPVEFHLWLFDVKEISVYRLKYIPAYFIVFCVYMILTSGINTMLANTGAGDGTKKAAILQYIIPAISAVGGTLIILNIYYWNLRINNFPGLYVNNDLNSVGLNIATFTMVPNFLFVSLINTSIYRKTKVTV